MYNKVSNTKLYQSSQNDNVIIRACVSFFCVIFCVNFMTSQHRKQLEQDLKLIQTLQVLPTAEQFLQDVNAAKTNQEQKNVLIPYLQQLHTIVHQILPKPNKGLWEPDLKLDPFLLTYFGLLELNSQYQDKKQEDTQQPRSKL